MIRTEVVERRVCPAELDQTVGPRPEPGEGAVIRHNAEGGAWLDARLAWGDRAAALFNDARAQCPAVQTPSLQVSERP
ncbi:hypothetical protein GVN24_24685 [Rhizobium sp. CRIBSB]|nr:hypothetical protein [Rhizobium sp. CRIBSB]